MAVLLYRWSGPRRIALLAAAFGAYLVSGEGDWLANSGGATHCLVTGRDQRRRDNSITARIESMILERFLGQSSPP
jgi:hypothetical protein